MLNIFQAIALGGPTAAKGLEEAVGVAQAMAAAFNDIPDASEVREALDAWGITWAEGGEPIHQMFSSKKTLRCTLPPGWEVKRRGGHFNLIDGNGGDRVHWYVHGWEAIEPRVQGRFSIRHERTGARSGVMQAMDGIRVIHAVPMRYTIARTQQAGGYWATPEDDETRAALWRDEDAVQTAARAEVRAWLDKQIPGWSGWEPAIWNLEY